MQEMNLQVEISNQMSHVGPWDDEQTIKYLIFLDQNKVVMTSKQKRKKFRVFDQMSDFISTRSSLQCRSHHQKAIQKYKQVRNIISFYKKQIGKDNFKFHCKQLKEKAKINQNYQVQARSVREQKQKVATIEVQNKKQTPFPPTNIVSNQFYNPAPINQFYHGFPLYTGVWPTNYFYFNTLI